MTLVIDGATFWCHKIVLAASSNFFKNLFDENLRGSETVILQGFKQKLIEHLLDFMYKGSVAVDSAQMEDFLDLAASLNVKGIGNLRKSPKDDGLKAFNMRRSGYKGCRPKFARYKGYTKDDREASLKLVQEGKKCFYTS